MSLVAIVGRPNVGKSTLFNRLVGQRKAIVDATAGTTRDRHYGKTDWNGKEFSVIDTGGYTVNSEDIFEDEIRRQVLLAISEEQMHHFAGNMLQVENGKGALFLVMSQSAYDSLDEGQLQRLSKYNALLPMPIPTIETLGGGSARCMMAEIFLKKEKH